MSPDNARMQRPSVLKGGTLGLLAATVIGLALASCSSDEPAATPTATPEPTPTPTLAADLLDRPWNVLYVGIDLNEQREGDDAPSNADALMLVSLSEDQSELTLVSLPRDT